MEKESEERVLASGIIEPCPMCGHKRLEVIERASLLSIILRCPRCGAEYKFTLTEHNNT